MDKLFHIIFTDTQQEPEIKAEPEPEIKAEPEIEIKILKKKYDQNQYNKQFMTKNINKIKEKVVCEYCCGSYTYYNKSKHLKSAKCTKLFNKLQLLKNKVI